MAIIGFNDQTGMSQDLQTSSSTAKLMVETTAIYLAGANEEVFKFGYYNGATDVGDGTNGIQFALYDLGTGPTVNGATRVATGSIAAPSANAWNTVTITPVALTQGRYYAVAHRVSSTTNIHTRRVSLTGGISTMNAGALAATWSQAGTLAFKYAVYAETQTASGTSTIAWLRI